MSSRFQEMTKQALSFLEGAGFRIAKRVGAEVLYESDQSFVLVMWDKRSGELDAFVGLSPRTGLPQDEYSLCDVLGAAGVAERGCQPPQVADEHRLEPFVEKLASDLRTHAQLALAGDRMFFRRVEVFRRDKAEAQMLEMRLRQVRGEVDAAWQDRRYDKVVRLYASIEGHLTESESRKLAYARQHVSP